MGLSINSNVPALTAQRQLGKSSKSLNSSFEKLASGKQVNKAADNAAAMAMIKDFEANERLYSQAAVNVSYGNALATIAEGTLEQVGNTVTRIEELAVSASSDTLGTAEREAIQAEVDQLTQELDRISASTEFNGQSLLNASGGSSTFDLQVGIDGTESSQLSISIPGTSSTALGLSSNVLSAEGARSLIDEARGAVRNISQSRGEIGVIQNRLETTYSNILVQRENLTSARSRLEDVDVASEAAKLANNKIKQQAGVSVLAQANILPGAALNLLK